MNTARALERLKQIATEGLNYTDDPYDRNRYDQLLEIVGRYYAELLDVNTGWLDQRFRNEIGSVTAKVGADALIMRDDGAILLHRRSDDGTWSLPGGWVDPGESPEDAVVREVYEETGVCVRIDAIANVATRLAAFPTTPFSSVHVLYVCSATGGELRVSHESSEVKYLVPKLVDKWHCDHGDWVSSYTSRPTSLPRLYKCAA